MCVYASLKQGFFFAPFPLGKLRSNGWHTLDNVELEVGENKLGQDL